MHGLLVMNDGDGVQQLEPRVVCKAGWYKYVSY